MCNCNSSKIIIKRGVFWVNLLSYVFFFLPLSYTCICISVLQHHGLLRERYIGTNQPALPPVSDAERKLLLTSLYYLIIGTSVTTSMSINSQHGDAIRLKLGEYFLCSSAGTITGDICQHYKDEADILMNTDMLAASFMLTTLFPIVHLFYACSFSKWCKKLASKQISSNASFKALKMMQV